MNKEIRAEKNKIILPKYTFLYAWFSVATLPWSVMLVVWIFFAGSLLISWEVPASGAVLVCGALISDILYQNQRWTKMNTDPTGVKLFMDDSNPRRLIAKNQFFIAPVFSGKLGILLSLARNSEVRINPDENTWYYNDTVARVRKSISLAIVLTAIVGTIVWGYGHLMFTAVK